MRNQDVKYNCYYYLNNSDYSLLCYVFRPSCGETRNYYYSKKNRRVITAYNDLLGPLGEIIKVHKLNSAKSKYLDYLTILNKVQQL